MSGWGVGTGSAQTREWNPATDGAETAYETVVISTGDLADDGEVLSVESALDPTPVVYPEDLDDEAYPEEVDPYVDAGGWNLVEGSSFESASPWTVGSGWTVPHVADPGYQAWHGTRVARLITAASQPGGDLISSAIAIDPALPGDWQVSWYSWMGAGTGSGETVLSEYDAAGALLVETAVGSVEGGGESAWTRHFWTIRSRSRTDGDHLWHMDTAYCRLVFRAASGSAFEWWVDAVQVERGAIRTAYAPRPHESIPGDAIEDGTLPGAAFDTTPPAVPSIARLTTTTDAMTDGTFVVRLHGFLSAHPSDADYAGCEWQATSDFTLADPLDPNSARTPDYTRPTSTFQSPGDAEAVLSPLLPVTDYWARARSRDTQGNRSAWSESVMLTTGGDGAAPPVPEAPTVQAIMRGLVVSWVRSSVPDIAVYEVRYRVTGALGDFAVVRTRGTVVNLSPLVATEDGAGVPTTSYDVNVRAIDTSGQVVTSATDSTPVQASTNDAAGWSATVVGFPLLVGTTDLAANSVTAVHVRAGAVTADKLGAGTIIVNTTTDPSHPDGISIQNATGGELARWDETGMYIWASATDQGSYLKLTAAAISMVRSGVTYGQITPDGIDATAIRLGTSPGGHNLIVNSSFELQQVGVTATLITDTAAADWSGNRVGSLDNMTENTLALNMTATAF